MISDVARLLAFARQLRRTAPVAVPVPPGIVLGITESASPVVIPTPIPEKAAHILVLAASGAGKTVAVANAMVDEFLAGEPAMTNRLAQTTVCVDGKGDLISRVIQKLAQVAPECLDRCVYLSPFSPTAFPFNLCKLNTTIDIDVRAIQLASLVAAVSTGTGSQKHLSVGARQVDVLTNVFCGVLTCPHPNASVAWALDALTEPHGLKLLAKMTTSARARQFLETADLGPELAASTAARVRAAFCSTSQLERIVCADSCLDIAEIMGPGRLVLIDLSGGHLSAIVRFWANLLVRLLVDHILARPSTPSEGQHHIRLAIDEFQQVAESLADQMEHVLSEARSKNASLAVMSQSTAMLNDASPTMVRLLIGNTQLRVIGRLGAPDAELLAREIAPRQGVDETPAAVRAKFSAAVTNLEDRNFISISPGKRERFRSLDCDVAAWEAAAASQADKIAAMKARHGLPPESGPRMRLSQAAAELKATKPPKPKERRPTNRPYG